MPNPHDEISAALGDAPSTANDEISAALGETSAPSDGWQDSGYGFKVKPFQFPNGSESVQRPDGAVYIKEANDSRFKGQEGWKVFDPKTGIWAPASSKDASSYGAIERRFGAPALQSWGRNLWEGVKRPIEAGSGLVADAAHAIGAMNDKDYLATIQANDEKERYRQAVQNTSGTGAGFTQLTGEMIPQAAMFAAAPEAAATRFATAESMAPTVVPLAQRAAANAVTAAPVAYVSTPGSAAERVKSALSAMAAAPVFTYAGKGLATLGGKAVDAVSGFKAPMAPEAQAIQDLGDKFGVRTLAPDLAANRPGLAKTAVLAESVPGSGMVAERTAQQAEARAAAEKLLAQHGIEGEVPVTIQQSLQSKLGSVKSKVRSAYDAVSQEAQGLGNVTPSSTLEAIRKFKAQEGKAVIPDKTLVGEGHHPGLLTVLENRLQPGKADLSYDGLRGLRSDLGSMIADYYKGTNATTGSKGVQVLQGVKGAVERDLKAFTDAQGGKVADLARKADSLYKNELVPLKDQVIVKATKNSEPDQIYKTIVAAGPDRAQKFYNAMDTNGQAAVRSQMVQDAFSNATKKDGVFSPAEFARSLEKIKDSTGVFFKGQDKWDLDGFTNLMRHIQPAGQINENPTNGQRLLQYVTMGEIPASMTAAALGHPGALAAPVVSAGASRAVTKLFSSAAGKRFLLSASSVKPGSPAMEALITKQLPAFLAAESPKNVTPFKPLPAAAQGDSAEPVRTAHQFDQQ